ncbi:MAG: alpha/beta hydrolase [Myxococcales bacterium]|nr:alpha/beta hydrolase [Myxococcales bacterium]
MLISMLGLAACEAESHDEPCTVSSVCRDELLLNTDGVLPYFRSHPLKRNASVRRVVVVVHGNRRDADRYFDRLVAAATAEDGLRDVALVAPHFQTSKDLPATDEHYWSSQGWKQGDASKDAKRISSFSAMNELLARLCSGQSVVFPRLTTVVIVGHSAGGQFVNRFAAAGEGCENPGVEVRYVVMNPSSYLYVDKRRKSNAEGFAEPVGECLGFNDYKFGLERLNGYMQRIGSEAIRTRLFARKVYYLAGEEDTKRGRSLDKRCEADLQGRNRRERHTNYSDYAELFDDWQGSVFLTVPGVGHNGRKMLMSDLARRIIFR